MMFMRAMAGILPNYSNFSTTQYVAYGYNIDGTLMSIPAHHRVLLCVRRISDRVLSAQNTGNCGMIPERLFSTQSSVSRSDGVAVDPALRDRTPSDWRPDSAEL